MTLTLEGESGRRPEYTYSRKDRAKAETARNPSANGGITDENFAQKVLQVLKPCSNPNLTAGQPPSLQSEEDGEENGPLTDKRCCVRNVHELLESGGSSRLYDELDYLVGELELGGDAKARRKCLEDLGTRLFTDMSAMRTSRLRSSGLLERIIRVTGREGTDDYTRRFLITLLYLLCGDVRRLDHFIGFKEGLALVDWLIDQEGCLEQDILTKSRGRSFSTLAIPVVKISG